MYDQLIAYFDSTEWRVAQIKELLRKHEELKKEMERTVTPKEAYKFKRECEQMVVRQYSEDWEEWREKKKR